MCGPFPRQRTPEEIAMAVKKMLLENGCRIRGYEGEKSGVFIEPLTVEGKLNYSYGCYIENETLLIKHGLHDYIFDEERMQYE